MHRFCFSSLLSQARCRPTARPEFRAPPARAASAHPLCDHHRREDIVERVVLSVFAPFSSASLCHRRHQSCCRPGSEDNSFSAYAASAASATHDGLWKTASPLAMLRCKINGRLVRRLSYRGRRAVAVRRHAIDFRETGPCEGNFTWRDGGGVYPFAARARARGRAVGFDRPVPGNVFDGFRRRRPARLRLT
jgi:hypothetical protein